MNVGNYLFKGHALRQKVKFFSLLMPLILIGACGSEEGNSSVKAHYFNEPYLCVTQHTSEKTGKTYTTGRFYHPEKNWALQLSNLDQKSYVKVANLHTRDGRYDGAYKGIYPDIRGMSFGSLWTNKKSEPGAVVLNGLNKAQKSDCSPLKDASAIFDSIDLSEIMFIDGVDQEK